MLWLIAQIFVCLLLAGLLGLFLGWLVWGRRPALAPLAQADAATGDAAAGDAQARILDLERELAACRAKAAAPVASSTPPVEVGAFGLFGPVAEVPIDDLKKISGVGVVIEKQLAGIGVTTYRQIAEFDAADIERVQEAIDFFPGRIVREDWLAQAARLHAEKYGPDV